MSLENKVSHRHRERQRDRPRDRAWSWPARAPPSDQLPQGRGSRRTRRKKEMRGRRRSSPRRPGRCVERRRHPAPVDETVATFGRLDIIVNNAGMETRTSTLDTTERQFDMVIAVDLKSAFFGVQLAAKQMIAQGGGGRIINISSIHEDWPMPGNSPYCAGQGRRADADPDGRRRARTTRHHRRRRRPGRGPHADRRRHPVRPGREGQARERHPARSRRGARGDRRIVAPSWPRTWRHTAPRPHTPSTAG